MNRDKNRKYKFDNDIKFEYQRQVKKLTSTIRSSFKSDSDGTVIVCIIWER